MTELFPNPAKHAVQKSMDILDVLKSCADAGLPCPSNADLAERTGYRSTASAADAISFLATCGLINVERFNHTRIVTICATGKQTADVRVNATTKIRKPHHSAQINSARAAA